MTLSKSQAPIMTLQETRHCGLDPAGTQPTVACFLILEAEPEARRIHRVILHNLEVNFLLNGHIKFLSSF